MSDMSILNIIVAALVPHSGIVRGDSCNNRSLVSTWLSVTASSIPAPNDGHRVLRAFRQNESALADKIV